MGAKLLNEYFALDWSNEWYCITVGGTRPGHRSQDSGSALNDREFHGTLVGFDDFVNMVLEDVEEFDGGIKKGNLKKMLLNGGQIAMLVTE